MKIEHSKGEITTILILLKITERGTMKKGGEKRERKRKRKRQFEEQGFCLSSA